MYNRTFILITTAFIKFNKNFEIKEKIKVSIKITNKNTNNENKNDSIINFMNDSLFDSNLFNIFNFSKIQQQRIFCYNFYFLKIQRQRIFYYNSDFLKIQR